MNQNQQYSNDNRHYRGKPKHQPRPQKRRARIAPEPPKRCKVRHLVSGRLMSYDIEHKELYLGAEFQHTIFPSKRKAQQAIWHTVQASGEPGSHVNYRIEEL